MATTWAVELPEGTKESGFAKCQPGGAAARTHPWPEHKLIQSSDPFGAISDVKFVCSHFRASKNVPKRIRLHYFVGEFSERSRDWPRDSSKLLGVCERQSGIVGGTRRPFGSKRVNRGLCEDNAATERPESIPFLLRGSPIYRGESSKWH